VHWAPGIPRALFNFRGWFGQQLGRDPRRENADLYPPSLRAQRSNPFLFRGTMDCFAALAMTAALFEN
jgi:hypothetical protein